MPRGHGWGRGRGRGGPGRLLRELLAGLPLPPGAVDEVYVPLLGGPQGEPVIVYLDELEAFRLVYLEGLTQEEAAARMGLSRGSLWRLLDSARRKLALALSSHRPLVLAAPPR